MDKRDQEERRLRGRNYRNDGCKDLNFCEMRWNSGCTNALVENKRKSMLMSILTSMENKRTMNARLAAAAEHMWWVAAGGGEQEDEEGREGESQMREPR